MKIVRSVFFALTLSLSQSVFAANPPPTPTFGIADVFYDAVMRPAGFVGTVLGSALFVAMTPATAINSLYSPHNTFEKFADLVVVNPFKFTFMRPIGDYNFPMSEKENQTRFPD